MYRVSDRILFFCRCYYVYMQRRLQEQWPHRGLVGLYPMRGWYLECVKFVVLHPVHCGDL